MAFDVVQKSEALTLVARDHRAMSWMARLRNAVASPLTLVESSNAADIATFPMQPWQPRWSPLAASADVEKRFRALADQWHRETRHMSLPSDIVLNESYQKVIGMGPAVLPCIFASLRTQPRYWFAALRAITGDNPVAPNVQGEMSSMTTAWLEWARSNGY